MNIFCSSNAKTNEEYRVILKNKSKLFAVLIVLGALTAAVSFCAELIWHAKISDKMLGVYAGTGTGLFFAGIILLVKNAVLLRDEEKLKKSRLRNTDERNMEICKKALSIAIIVMFVVLYLVALIGGLFYPVLIYVLLILAASFLVAYAIAHRYYNTKM